MGILHRVAVVDSIDNVAGQIPDSTIFFRFGDGQLNLRRVACMTFLVSVNCEFYHIAFVNHQFCRFIEDFPSTIFQQSTEDRLQAVGRQQFNSPRCPIATDWIRIRDGAFDFDQSINWTLPIDDCLFVR